MTAKGFDRGNLWIDFIEYADRLFSGNGDMIWTNPSQFLSVYGQGQQLVQSDVLSVPISSFFRNWLDMHSEMIEPAWRKKSITFVCKKILALKEPKQVMREVLSGLQSLYSGHPIALVIDSPRRWLLELKKRMGGENGGEPWEPAETEIDAAAMYLADYLRSFSEYRISVLVLDEEEADPTEIGEIWSLYQPVWNVASHYQWDKGVRWRGEAVSLPVGTNVDFVLFPTASWEKLDDLRGRGMVAAGGLTTDFWEKSSPIPAAGYGMAYGVIPADAHPEHVLDQLKALHEKK